MLWVKQSTAVILKLGPFVDSTDAVTPETALSIAQADIQISKNGGAFAQTSDASPTTTHDADGWYPIPLTATDTNTLGTIKVQVAMAGALPVWAECMVLPAVTYDSLVAGSDTLDVNITSISGGGTAADALEAVFDGTGSLAAGLGLMESFELFGFVLYHGEIGTVTSQTEFTITGGEESVDDDAYNNSLAVIVDSVNTKQKAVGLVSDYTGSTQTLFLASDPGIFTIASGDMVLLLPLPSSIGSVTGNVGGIAGTIQTLDALDTAQDTQHATTQAAIAALNDFDPANDTVAHVTLVDTTTTNTDMRGTDSAYTGTPPTAAAIADAVWDEATSGHSTAGTTGKALTDTLADTNELQTNQGNWLTATGFSTHSAADVWSVATRVLTAATNVTSDGSAITMSSAGVVGTVNLVNTTTTNTDMVSAAPSAASIADAVWDEATSGHTTAGTTGKALTDAGSAGDPWSTALPGAYGAGTAGYLVGTYIDAAISDTATAASVAALNDLSTADIDARLAAYDPPTNAEMVAAFTEIKGATWSSTTDTLEALRDRGDAAWSTATGFSTHSAADVWAVGARTVTAATNITSDGAAIATTAGVIDHVTLVDTTTTNTDMRGTDSAYTGTPPTAAAIADQVWDEVASGHTTAGTTGKLLSDSGAAGDPWSTALPGAYGSGTAGYIVGTNLDAAVSGANTTTPPTAAAIADAVCDEALSGHTTAGTVGKAIADILDDTGTTLPAAISAIDAGTGSGDNTVTVTVNNGSTAIQSARVTYKLNGMTIATGLTNSSGVAPAFSLNAATYTVVITAAGYTFTPTTHTVSGDATPIYSMTALAISPSAAADTVTAYGYTRDTELAIEVSQVVYFRLITAPTGNGDILDGAEFSKTSDGTTGLVQLTMIKGGVYETRRAGQKWQQITIPTTADDPYELPNIL